MPQNYPPQTVVCWLQTQFLSLDRCWLPYATRIQTKGQLLPLPTPNQRRSHGRCVFPLGVNAAEFLVTSSSFTTVQCLAIGSGDGPGICAQAQMPCPPCLLFGIILLGVPLSRCVVFGLKSV